MEPLSRRRFIAAAGLAALAGCTGGDSSESTTTTEPPNGEHSDGSDGRNGSNGSTTTEEAVVESTVPVRDSTLPLPMDAGQLREEARSGGPPKDGIPSIDEPRFVEADAVDYLRAAEPVFGVQRNGVTKAYPQKILVWHEIVNDTLGDLPVSVTYCPLTGTVLGFERGETTFGVSGRLVNSNLIMYDRETEAWWPQILATAIPGPWNEAPERRSLREFRLVWTTWEQWRQHNPETLVLSTNTGHAQNYGRDPYGSYVPRGGYYENDRLLFGALHSDDRFEKKTVVLGARTPDGAAAFHKGSLREEQVLSGDLGGTAAVAVHDQRYDTGYTYLNPEAQEVAADGDTIRVAGEAHAPDELPLDRVHTFDAMWFAWYGMYPETTVVA